MTDDELRDAIAAIPYWYHAITLRPGITTPGWSPIDASVYRIPDDLTGNLVLDVGAWDGYWTFEAARRGAYCVEAIDDFSDTVGQVTNADRSNRWKTFDLCASAIDTFGIDCDIQRSTMSVYELPIWYGRDYISFFDTIFLFGVLYHLRHPLLALEKLRAVAAPGATLHIETAILDNCKSAYGDNGYDGSECVAEFYPGAEYGMNPSNWHVGTLKYWVALVESAGFNVVDSWRLTEEPTMVSECRGFISAVAK